jgi:hypothetical protein
MWFRRVGDIIFSQQQEKVSKECRYETVFSKLLIFEESRKREFMCTH